MELPQQTELDELWAAHNASWRAPAQVMSHWEDTEVDPRLLRYSVRGAWWETLARLGITLLVTREYEHLLLALRADEHGPAVSYTKVPHPSGLAVDLKCGIVHVASTRNPNQLWDLAPVTGLVGRTDVKPDALQDRPLIPVRSRLFPGYLYMHDLAVIGGELYANSVGQNAVVHLHADGRFDRVWWPECIERAGAPIFDRNHIQLNSIAAGLNLAASYFSASTEVVSARRPGHRNFSVDQRGVIFSGATRRPMVRGLTRPHSVRLHAGRVWVNNSGYGELGYAEDGSFVPTVKLPGWSRGLCFHGEVAFVGSSRVIARFAQYAPGLDVNASVCGLHAVATRTGEVLGSLIWPYGNQVFAIEAVPSAFTTGFLYPVGTRRATTRDRQVLYAFSTSVVSAAGKK
ncbi:MAG: DUF4915 domain-containing protein [Ktedonobacterales bacterium]